MVDMRPPLSHQNNLLVLYHPHRVSQHHVMHLELFHSIGSIATLNQQRPIHRPHIQDLVHVIGRMPSNCVPLFNLLQP